MKVNLFFGTWAWYIYYFYTELKASLILALIRHINEKYLLVQVANGDEKAFEELFYAYHNQLGAYILGWTKSPVTTEEIVQDIFLKIWLNRQALETVDRFDNYLYILSRNYTFNTLRSAARERVKRQDWARHFEEEQDFVDDTNTLDYMPLIEQAVAKLPPQQQKVYQLKRQQGLKYDEIARQMDIAPETARKHLAAALRSITGYVRANLPVFLLLLISHPGSK
jgi:RNA polymerase sigma-70 factor (family 1)